MAAYWIHKHIATADDSVRLALLRAGYLFQHVAVFEDLTKDLLYRNTANPVFNDDSCPEEKVAAALSM